MKLYYRIIFTAVFSFGLLGPVIAQETRTVTGRVTSEEGSVPGANVVIKGTATGTATGLEGKYQITVSNGDTLVFSFVGHQNREVVVRDQEVINVSLALDFTELDQVVVIGYGEVKKRDLTAAVSVVQGEILEAREASSIQQVLQGQMAGLQVYSDGGAPGSAATVLIRGISTINNNSPLYVVDGNQLSDIEFLNPKDIASVQVLKDASAAAIYGSRASNGVILITTKKARVGESVITFDASFGLESAAKSPDMADAFEYARIANLAAENSGEDPIYPDPDIFGAGTNWWDELTQTGLTHNYNLTISKGTETFRVYTGINYYNQEGMVKGGGYDRINFKLNSEFNVTPKLKIGENITIANSMTTNGPGLVWDVQRVEPITTPELPDYEQEGKNEYSIFSPTYTDVGNPLGQLARSFNTTGYFRTVGNVYIDWQPIDGLTIKSQYNLYISNWENNWFSPDYYIEENDKNDQNSVGRSHNNRFNYQWENYATYSREIGFHSFSLLGGVTFEAYSHKMLEGSASEVPNNSPDLRYLNAATIGWFSSGTDEEAAQQSFFGRINYSYGGKYLVQASVRYDGSSVFPKDNQYGLFPAVSGAWVISEEEFMDNVASISQLKLRASWGQVGNQNFNDPYNKYYQIGTFYTTMGANQEPVVGTGPRTIGNNDLVWETVEDINLGLDLNILKNKLSYNLDVFQRNSYNNIIYKSVYGYMGYGYEQQLANVGELQAKGIEMSLRYRDNIGSFFYNIGLNGSSIRTRMSQLAEGNEIIWDGNHQRLNNLTVTMVDETAGSFYGYVTDGIFQNRTEINSHSDEYGNLIQPDAEPGDFRFKDLNGDGVLNELDRKIIGNPEPILTYGINLNLEYKGFSLNMLFTGTYGNDMLNAIRPYTSTGEGYYNAPAGLLEKAWSGEGSTQKQPIIKQVDQNQNFRYSDYYVEDGSYFRLKNIQLGYSLPSRLLAPVSVDGIRIYVSVENAFTITEFSGMDPDIGGSATLRGIDWGHYPLPRVFTAGLKLTL
jgi:TonB-dependent starch-binding outer membrane protein SusC